MNKLIIFLCQLLVCAYPSHAQYYPDEGINIISKDEEITGAEHISIISYYLPVKPEDADLGAVVHGLAEQARAAGGNVVKLLSLKTLVPGDSLLCYAVVMKIPDPVYPHYVFQDDFYFVIVDELIEHPKTESKAYFFTSPMRSNRILDDDRGLLLTMEDSFSCFFEKNTVCSRTVSTQPGGELYYFMMTAGEDDEPESIEVHYKDGYHICKVYERLNALKEK
ncbi:MAG: hypothetical protein KDC07_12225 [Chitinophagaceae bacterium]|nr:hypothetical protein [Chitinophagaceae bacterium]